MANPPDLLPETLKEWEALDENVIKAFPVQIRVESAVSVFRANLFLSQTYVSKLFSIDRLHFCKTVKKDHKEKDKNDDKRNAMLSQADELKIVTVIQNLSQLNVPLTKSKVKLLIQAIIYIRRYAYSIRAKETVVLNYKLDPPKSVEDIEVSDYYFQIFCRKYSISFRRFKSK